MLLTFFVFNICWKSSRTLVSVRFLWMQGMRFSELKIKKLGYYFGMCFCLAKVSYL